MVLIGFSFIMQLTVCQMTILGAKIQILTKLEKESIWIFTQKLAKNVPKWLFKAISGKNPEFGHQNLNCCKA